MADKTSSPPVDALTCALCECPWKLLQFGEEEEKASFSGIMADCCRECRINYSWALWAHASTWAQVVFLSYCFIRGGIWSTPSHWGPLDSESTGINSGFKRRHEYGIITTDSQPYSRLTTDISTSTCDPTAPDERFLEVVQRPYLGFIISTLSPQIPKAKVENWIHRLLRHDDILTIVFSDFDKYPDWKNVSEGFREIKALGKEDMLYALVSSARTIFDSLHLTRCAPTVEILETTPLLDDTESFSDGTWDNQPFDSPMTFFKNDDAIDQLATKIKTISIRVYAKNFHADLDMQTIVEEVCIAAGLERIFHDINDWTTVPSDDPAQDSLVAVPEIMMYENKLYDPCTYQFVDPDSSDPDEQHVDLQEGLSDIETSNAGK